MPTILLAIKKNYGIGMVGLLIFTPLLILFTGILNRFIFIPEWYPNQPTIFAPGQVIGRPPFSQYTFAWKLSERWLFQINLTDAIWLFVFLLLFFLNIVLMAEIYRNKAKFYTLNWLAYPVAFIAFVGCCGSTLFILLFGVGALIALAPYVFYFRILAVVLFGFNVWFMARKLKMIPLVL